MAFEINKVYNFQTLAPTVLGNTYKGMKVKGIITADEAVKRRDIHTLHAALLPVISNLPLNVNDCTYLLLTSIDGSEIVLATEYIETVSIELVTTVNIRLEVFDATTGDIATLTEGMRTLGHNNVKVTTF